MNRSAESPLLWLILQEKCFTIGNQERNNGRYGWCRGGRREIGSETEEDSFHEAEVRIYGRHHGGGFFGCFFMSVSGSQRHYGTDQADSNYFAKVFKRINGVIPSEFRG